MIEVTPEAKQSAIAQQFSLASNPALYAWYETQIAAASGYLMMAEASRWIFENPLFGTAKLPINRMISAGSTAFSEFIKMHAKPEWNLADVMIAGEAYPVTPVAELRLPFCDLTHFSVGYEGHRPKLLLVAPMSGHYATLLRGTVAALLTGHDVYITEWRNARDIPLLDGLFNVDDYIGYLMHFMRHLAPDLHVVGVCQPAPMVLCAVALLAMGKDKAAPASMVLMGGPIDTRAAETEVTRLAASRAISWFERNLISTVPLTYPGRMRRVYPGFMQLGAFMAMNPARHLDALYNQFKHLVGNDGDAAAAHRKFYDEYLAVMDVTAEFYIETVRRVFQEHHLPLGTFQWRDTIINPAAITSTALMTVEGELDDISAPGQTLAAHELCPNIPAAKKIKLLQPNTGHYGIFNGRNWRTQIMPRIAAFIRAQEAGRGLRARPRAKLRSVA